MSSDLLVSSGWGRALHPPSGALHPHRKPQPHLYKQTLFPFPQTRRFMEVQAGQLCPDSRVLPGLCAGKWEQRWGGARPAPVPARSAARARNSGILEVLPSPTCSLMGRRFYIKILTDLCPPVPLSADFSHEHNPIPVLRCRQSLRHQPRASWDSSPVERGCSGRLQVTREAAQGTAAG